MAGLNNLVADGAKLKAPSLKSAAVGGFTNKELMEDARSSLSGNWGVAILGMLLFWVLLASFMVFVVSSIVFVSASSAVDTEAFVKKAVSLYPLIQPIQLILAGPVMVGVSAFFLSITQEGAASVEALFAGFRRFWRSLALYFFYTLFVGLWSLLLIIPGIIAQFRYAMAFYVMAEDEDCGPLEALRRSKEMMGGNKWKFFCLHWRFIGWALLCSILPVGYFWLVPYMQTSFAKFYDDVS
ncbi:MAG: DUF975 family protein [Pontiellaceae bacterium]|nr:DUF975 family protein [Pontiellaceae bacterium]MBN2784428.1 DUF975 family protein [Pontiellaceae bacterium]